MLLLGTAPVAMHPLQRQALVVYPPTAVQWRSCRLSQPFYVLGEVVATMRAVQTTGAPRRMHCV